MNGLVSVCIPVLNEAAQLPVLLAQLRAQRDVALDIIVADGGSADGTLEAVPAFARSVSSPRGRGAQMNAAAAMARGDTLLFLHADSRLPAPRLLADALAALDAAQRDSARVAGHFPLRFECGTRRNALLYRYMEAKSALNRPGTINGDQGMLMSRRFFDSLGGFDETRPFLEDQDIAARVFATGRWITLPGRLGTSARRFESLGPWRVYAFMAIIMIAWQTSNEAFLARVPSLYAQRLDARAVLRAVWRTRWRWLAGGGYAMRNLWQIFFFIKVALRKPLSLRERGWGEGAR